jgi:ABC-type transport system involved in multi-copper enzyme maturation permease subunit
MFLVLLLLSSLPVLSLVFVFGGIGPRQIILATLTTLFVLATITSIGLYCSAYFRRSVHATAVTYAIIIAITAVSGIVFAILISHWERSPAHQGQGAQIPPFWVRAPLFLNPYYLVTLSFGSYLDWSSDGLSCLMAFLLLFLFSFVFAVRHIRHSGEQS